jgi:hypothetical protein
MKCVDIVEKEKDFLRKKPVHNACPLPIDVEKRLAYVETVVKILSVLVILTGLYVLSVPQK